MKTKDMPQNKVTSRLASTLRPGPIDLPPPSLQAGKTGGHPQLLPPPSPPGHWVSRAGGAPGGGQEDTSLAGVQPGGDGPDPLEEEQPPVLPPDPPAPGQPVDRPTPAPNSLLGPARVELAVTHSQELVRISQ